MRLLLHYFNLLLSPNYENNDKNFNAFCFTRYLLLGKMLFWQRIKCRKMNRLTIFPINKLIQVTLFLCLITFNNDAIAQVKKNSPPDSLNSIIPGKWNEYKGYYNSFELNFGFGLHKTGIGVPGAITYNKKHYCPIKIQNIILQTAT
ncbi:MAG: hypothetical protein WCM76_16540, partial [Bacteroidota bacterium]